MSRTTVYRELDEVEAPADIGEVGVEVGDRGVVVEVFEHPRPAIMVEYADGDGRTKALAVYSPGLERLLEIIPEPA